MSCFNECLMTGYEKISCKQTLIKAEMKRKENTEDQEFFEAIILTLHTKQHLARLVC